MGFLTGLWIRLKIGGSLLIVVLIWGILASIITGIITFPISFLLSTAIISAAPTGYAMTLAPFVSLLIFIAFLPLTALFFGIVVPLLPEAWFMKNWRRAKEKNVF